jgi:FADH2 O2-dependent halogenase
LHHVFDGGWIWVLHFNNGVTSAGAAVTDALADALRLSEGGAAWQRLLARLPTVGEQFAEAKAVRPFVHLARLPFRSRAVVGKRWALLPSAASVVDPLLSTGFPLTLFGVARLAEAMEKDWGQPRFDRRLAAYGEQTLKELDATARIVGALYGNMRDFELFAALTLLYFAAASFSESARRMHRLEQAASFLLIDHPQFGPALRDCCERSRRPLTPSQRSELIEAIYRTIAPIDVAGLGRRERRNWHPAADDTPSPSRPVK